MADDEAGKRGRSAHCEARTRACVGTIVKASAECEDEGFEGAIARR